MRYLSSVAVALVTTIGIAPASAETIIDPNEPDGLKSPATAMTLSLGTTAVSWAALGLAIGGDHHVVGTVGMLGAYFGPSAGHLYAGQAFTRGFAARTLGGVATLAGLGHAMSCPLFSGPCDRPALSTALISAGIAAMAFGTVDDIVRAPASVRPHNARIRALAVAPTVTQDHVGLVARGSF